MVRRSHFSTCADGCLEQLKSFLFTYTGTERPTHEILRLAYAEGDDLPSDPNVFSAYYGKLELAVDKAVVSLEREHPDWTPSWRKAGAKVAIKVRRVTTGTEPMGSYLKHSIKGVERMGRKRKVRQPPTEEEQSLLNILVGMYRDNGYNLPSWRQITKNSLINESELLRVLGKDHGRAGVMSALEEELNYRKHHAGESSDDEPRKKNRKRSPKRVAEESVAEVAEKAEGAIISEATSEMTPMESSATIKPESTTVTTASNAVDPVIASEPVIKVKPEIPPKRCGKARSSYDEELKKLVYYYELLNGKVPGQYDLQKLAKSYPGQIRGYMTLVRYLGPQSGWAKLIQDHLAEQAEESP